MAVKWAVANGAWNTGATWNGGVVPTIDDVVYLDGHTISIPASLSVKEIRNDVNPNTNLEGGSINCNVNNITITADLYAHTSYLVLCSVANTTIVGNIYGCDVYSTVNSNCVFYSNTTTINITINGNIDNREGYCIFGAPGSRYMFWVINGNAKVNHYINGGSYNGAHTYIINGNLEAYGYNDWYVGSTYGATTINITGNLIGDMYFSATLTIGAGYYYTNRYNLNMHTATFISDSPTIRYIGAEPNPNNYIVLGKNELAQTYPTEDKVLSPTQYGAQMELVGQYTPDYPPESVVLKDFEYGDSDDRKTGTMEQEVNVEVGCVTKEDVREGVPLLGMGEVGTCAVPPPDDVREGVPVDNTVGTLIVQGGGDRLRIADFGYYTNAQSDTYIVDLTEQDKPKFAVAEERVLIEMFPELDLDNIPDKYFDDLFVKYLKYRLIVEYYRTAGINSTFTPSEPTTEIVNYQNVRNEVWLNSANIYLKAWGKKYPDSIVKPHRILL